MGKGWKGMGRVERNGRRHKRWRRTTEDKEGLKRPKKDHTEK